MEDKDLTIGEIKAELAKTIKKQIAEFLTKNAGNTAGLTSIFYIPGLSPELTPPAKPAPAPEPPAPRLMQRKGHLVLVRPGEEQEGDTPYKEEGRARTPMPHSGKQDKAGENGHYCTSCKQTTAFTEDMKCGRCGAAGVKSNATLRDEADRPDNRIRIDPDDLARSEVEFGERLEKPAYNTGEFVRRLAELGWTGQKVTKEYYFEHPTVSVGAVPIIGKLQRLTLSHDQQQTVPADKVNVVLRDAGLQINDQGQFEPKPGHRYFHLYVQSGHAKQPEPGTPMENPVKTWTPKSVPEWDRSKMVSVPMDKLIPTLEVGDGDWKVAKYKKSFQANQHSEVPHVTAMDNGDGTYSVDSGHEALLAARAHGMTHAPVMPI